MDFLTPPTDNLYKFMAIAGLALVIGAGILTYKQVEKQLEPLDKCSSDLLSMRVELSKIVASGHKLQDELKEAGIKHDELESRKQQLESEAVKQDAALAKSVRGSVEEKNAKEAIKQGTESAKALLLETDALSGTISGLRSNAERDSNRESEIAEQIAGTKAVIEAVKEEGGNVTFLDIACGLVSGLGAVISVIGFVSWYIKVQRFQDRLLEAEVTAKLKEIAPAPSPIVTDSR